MAEQAAPILIRRSLKQSIPAPQPQPARPRRPRAALIWLVVGLLFLLVTTVAVMGYYLVTHRPVTDLPAVERVTRAIPPRPVFTFAGVANPIGVALSPDGQRVYVAEGGGDRLIRVFDREGRQVGQTAPPNTKPGTRKPGQLATDAEGRLYAIDRLRGTVDIYGPDLKWQRDWIPAAVQSLGGWIPNGVSVGPDGRIYVSDIGKQEHRVLAFKPDGSLASYFSKSTGIPGGLNYPVQAVADDAGRIYITDASGGRVVVAGPRGIVSIGTSGEETVSLPIGIMVAGQKLFVADAAAHRIVVFATGDRPQFLHAFGDTEDGDGLAYPSAVTVDRTQRIYVADRANDRVQVWTY